MILDGDGFTDYVRPFRTIEDSLITAGCLGHLIKHIRDHYKSWNAPHLLEKSLSLALCLRELCEV